MNRTGYALLAGLFILSTVGCSHQTPITAAQSSGGTKHAASASKLTKLEIVDTRVGDGGEFEDKRAAAKGDTVIMMYVGKLADGTVFDSNTPSDGKDPFVFTLGEGNVIKGWDEGVAGMKIGGVRELSIPSELAYGDKAMGEGKIPANSDLYFTVTLLDIIHPGDETSVIPDDKKVGTGPEVGPGKTVDIHYTVTDCKGNPEDDNDISWTIGDEKVYKSIEVGMQGMKQGGVRVLRLAPRVSIPKNPKMPVPGTAPQLVKIELKKVH